jgi:hypothetical protein
MHGEKGEGLMSFTDLVGIIPNVVIISLCITAIAITKLNRKRKDHGKET